MTVTLQPLVETLLGLAAAVVMAAIPVLVPALLRRLRLANNAELVRRVQTAAEVGAGLAYRYASAQVGGLSTVTVQNAALARGVAHVSASVPQALNELGVTPQHVAQMVAGRLGQLLAADPTVTAGTPSPAGVVSMPSAANLNDH